MASLGGGEAILLASGDYLKFSKLQSKFLSTAIASVSLQLTDKANTKFAHMHGQRLLNKVIGLDPLEASACCCVK